MKRLIKARTQSESSTILEDFPMTPENTIYITMYLRPVFFENSQFVVASHKRRPKFRSDLTKPITGPLSEKGRELEPPIKQEYESFILDCVDAIKDEGFIIISEYRSTDSKKSEYIVLYGMEDQPCGYVVYDLRISDHPLDMIFPEELKDEALEFLKINKVLDESATKAGINFRVAKVTVGQTNNDTWGKALDRLYAKLDDMRRKIRKTMNTRKAQGKEN